MVGWVNEDNLFPCHFPFFLPLNVCWARPPHPGGVGHTSHSGSHPLFACLSTYYIDLLLLQVWYDHAMTQLGASTGQGPTRILTLLFPCVSHISHLTSHLLHLCAVHVPQVWYDHAMTQLELAQDRGLAVLQRAQRALPGCSLLRLAQAEVEEAAGRIEEAKQVRL
jgi:hypothetical protein